jgi:hypothetical protein
MDKFLLLFRIRGFLLTSATVSAPSTACHSSVSAVCNSLSALCNIHLAHTLGRQFAYSHAQAIELHTSCEQGTCNQIPEHLSSIGLVQYHMYDFELAFDSSHKVLCIRRQHLGNDDHPDQHLGELQD